MLTTELKSILNAKFMAFVEKNIAYKGSHQAWPIFSHHCINFTNEAFSAKCERGELGRYEAIALLGRFQWTTPEVL